MSKEFIIGVREHSLFGYLFTAYFVRQVNNEYSKVLGNIINDDVVKNPTNFNDIEKKIIKIINEYSDDNLVKTFSQKKKISVTEFFSNIPVNFIEERIRPFIERRLIIIIDLLKENNIKMYRKVDRFENIYYNEQIFIKDYFAEAVFNFIRNQNETRYFLSALHEEKEIKLNKKVATILSIDPCRIIINNELYFFKDIDAKKLLPFFTREFISIPKRTEKKYYETFVLNSIRTYKVNANGFKINTIKPKQQAILTLDKDFKNYYVLNLCFKYDNIIYLSNNNNSTTVNFEDNNDNYVFTIIQRDLKWEKFVIEFLISFELIFDKDINFKINFTGENVEKQNFETINWLNNNSEKIEKFGIEIKQKFINIKYYTKEILLDFKVKTERDWFDIYAMVKFGTFELPFIKLKRHLKTGNRLFQLPDSTFAVIPDEWFAKYTSLLTISEGDNVNFKIKKYHFATLDNIENNNILHEGTKLNNIFKNIEEHNFSIPTSINANLRDYQKYGFAWLYTLYENNFGGCLADDMGLGKTLQTIVLLTKLIEERKNVAKNIVSDKKNVVQQNLFETNLSVPKKRKLPSLIVMPKSLIFNWFNEFKKFSPHIKVLNYVGSFRENLFREIFYYDIVITSYGLVRNDSELLKKVEFFYVILDESQNIKNPDSKIYKSVIDLKSERRLVITGTPIENSLQDLWAQMNFVNEGLLGTQTFFKENYINLIEKKQEIDSTNELKKLIQPFILRRKKQDVAKDLPSLTEQTFYCELDEEQRKIYMTEKSKIRNQILEMIGIGQIKNSTIHVFHALMQLRQIANHPKMVMETNASSGKFEVITSVLQTLISENHKVLIFSSFVKHLKLLEDYLIDKNLEYSILTGSSNNRQKIIEEFQNNENNKIFLISIKAGGVGLNLTSADYVFILDPWWNPAVENQAINRAHRIGQNKKVMVYKFITKDTIEEKIKKLQDDKNELAEIFVNSNNPFKNMNENIILNLFD